MLEVVTPRSYKYEICDSIRDYLGGNWLADEMLRNVHSPNPHWSPIYRAELRAAVVMVAPPALSLQLHRCTQVMHSTDDALRLLVHYAERNPVHSKSYRARFANIPTVPVGEVCAVVKRDTSRTMGLGYTLCHPTDYVALSPGRLWVDSTRRVCRARTSPIEASHVKLPHGRSKIWKGSALVHGHPVTTYYYFPVALEDQVMNLIRGAQIATIGHRDGSRHLGWTYKMFNKN